MQDQLDKSSNTIQSDSLRVATSRFGSIEKTQSSTSKSLYECIAEPTVPTMEASSSVPYTRTNKTSVVFPLTMTWTLSGVLEFFHIRNFSNASEDEAMFFLQLHFKLLANAKILAREGEGKCDRAYTALLNARRGVESPHESEAVDGGGEDNARR
jgi:hypothetical protein